MDQAVVNRAYVYSRLAGDPDLREIVALNAGVTANAALAEALRAFARQRLAPFKCPRSIVFIDELPKTATGKIRRHVLRGADIEARDQCLARCRDQRGRENRNRGRFACSVGAKQRKKLSLRDFKGNIVNRALRTIFFRKRFYNNIHKLLRVSCQY